MRFRELGTDEDLEAFRDQAEHHLAIRFPLEYLKNGKVVALFARDGQMLGGYALITQPPFRVLASLPAEVRSHSPILRRLPMASLFEITAFWVAPESLQKRASFHLWFRLYRDAICLGKRYFVYSYSLTKPSLGRLYRICRPEVIFRGETLLLPGMPGLDVESVETSSVARAALFMALHPGFFLGRLFGRRRGRKRQHADPIEAGD